jgi:hypothetical protein
VRGVDGVFSFFLDHFRFNLPAQWWLSRQANPISQASAFFGYPKETGRQEAGEHGVLKKQTKSESD